MVPAQIFPTADGWLTLFITHDRFWQKFCEEADRREWIADPRFATMAGRRENREHVLACVAEVLKTASAAEWVRRLAPLGVVVSQLDTLSAALQSDLTRSRNLVVRLGETGLRAIAPPVRFEGFTPCYGPPPLLGEHGQQLLEQVAS